MSGKLFYSVNVIIASLRKKPLITHHNTIKNLIIQWNDEIKNSPLSRQIQIKIGPLSSIEKENKFRYKDRIPREKWENEGRITDWITENKLWKKVGVENFNPEIDRVMICGSEEMTFDLKQIFERLGSREGSTKVQGGFVIEKAFAEK